MSEYPGQGSRLDAVSCLNGNLKVTLWLCVIEYLREDQASPYKKWFDSLSAPAAAKVAVAKLRMELGNKWFDGLGEYRIDWGPGLRIYLMRDGERLVVLFGGGGESTQKADIRKAWACSKSPRRASAAHERTPWP